MPTPLLLPTIAFLGIGLMGAPMAQRICEAGYAVRVWNRTASKTDPLRACATVAPTPDAAVRGVDIVVTMLDSGPIVAEVLEAALASISPGTLVIDMSSTAQSEAVTLSALLASRGARFIDAPVSGGVTGAREGTLAIMAGGSEGDYARAEALFKVLGRSTWVGPTGCGQLAKLCNQLIVGGTIAIVAEALLLAQAGGAHPAAVRAAIRGGFAESRILEVHGARMLERDFRPGGQVKSQSKDMDNVLQAAAATGLHLPVSELVATLYCGIMDNLANADQAAALLALERQNPGKRLGSAPDLLPEQS